MDHDPRVYLAAERTLLAWVRTSIAVVALGFVVARFGLFLALVRGAHATTGRPASLALGVFFVFIGAAINVHATAQFSRFVGSLPASAIPESHWPRATITSSLALAVAALLLVVYLLV